MLQGQVLPSGEKIHAGVSAMGFGGINAHITLESGDWPAANLTPATEERALLASHQHTELFVCGGASQPELCLRLREIAHLAEELSVGELTDLAAHLADELPVEFRFRAAVVAGNPEELAAQLLRLADYLCCDRLQSGQVISGPKRDWWVGISKGRPRLGFLFPGQGSQQLGMARILVERFSWARDLAERADVWMTEIGGSSLTPLIFRPLDRASGPEVLRHLEPGTEPNRDCAAGDLPGIAALWSLPRPARSAAQRRGRS